MLVCRFLLGSRFPGYNFPVISRLDSSGQSQKSKIRPLRKNVYTSRFSTVTPKSYNTHIYHFHISESLDLVFFPIIRASGGEIS
jgi:hypothetical protein